MKKPFEFRDKTVLITGASQGIGEEFAHQVAQQGANVILTARSKDKLESLAKEIEGQYQVKAHTVESDLSVQGAAEKLIEAVKAQNLHVDVLINNAGFGRNGNFEEATVDEDHAMIQLNFNSLVALSHLVIPDMLKKGEGGILNVASTAAFQPLPFFSLYSATKAAVLNFSEGLWGEYQPRGIRILCLCPGNTRTGFHDRADVKNVFLVARAKDVARHGLLVFCKRSSPSTVYGWINLILANGYRIGPRRVVTLVGKWLFRKPS